MSLKAGDSFPQDVVFSYVTHHSSLFHLPALPFQKTRHTLNLFDTNTPSSYIPWSEDKGEITSCGIPINYYASKEWADKKVILFALPGSSPLVPSLLNPQGSPTDRHPTCRCLHPRLLCQPRPRVHPEAPRAACQGCRRRCRPGLQRCLRHECLGQGQRCYR